MMGKIGGDVVDAGMDDRDRAGDTEGAAGEDGPGKGPLRAHGVMLAAPIARSSRQTLQKAKPGREGGFRVPRLAERSVLVASRQREAVGFFEVGQLEGDAEAVVDPVTRAEVETGDVVVQHDELEVSEDFQLRHDHTTGAEFEAEAAVIGRAAYALAKKADLL